MLKRLFTILTFMLVVVVQGHAQDEQLWLDFQLSYPFANRYLLENTTSYQTLLNKDGKWRNISMSPTFEYVLLRRLELTAEIPFGYTQQTEGLSSWEISPIVGGRFHITQNKKIDTRFLLRYQTRAFREIEAEDWDISNRTRLKGEFYWSINGPNLFTDKLWYLFADYEEFFVFDHQVDERYANRRRGRIGVGYRLSYMHRFDLSFTKQSSRNEIEGEFISNDNVIQFKYKLFLNPARPATP
ncbi:MAG TPA: DUF2490 domain-containing protein [Cyclobacteriaceae bacterium]|nr:DUF2490 domain-containing protein [Cyclobacteriaceae bacterium]